MFKISEIVPPQYDLTGRTFGQLSVLRLAKGAERSGNDRGRQWVTKCNCGREVVVSAVEFVHKDRKYCGRACPLSKVSTFKLDLTGKVFGQLTVVNNLPSYKGKTRWLVKCQCGIEKVMTTSDLRGRKRVSCGCGRKERAVLRVLGKKFGCVTATRLASVEESLSFIKEGPCWLVKCDCGIECVKPASRFANAARPPKSCGFKCAMFSHANRIRRNEDLVGCRFSCLTVVRKATQEEKVNLRLRSKGNHWLVKCQCGEETIRTSSSLKHAGCACARNKPAANRLAFGEAARNTAYAQMKLRVTTTRRPRTRGLIPWELTKEQFLAIVSKPCRYCGIEWSKETGRRTGDRPLYGTFKHNGIDRVNSLKGYILGNCVACCKICNFAKNTLTEDEFRNHIARMYSHFVQEKHYAPA